MRLPADFEAGAATWRAARRAVRRHLEPAPQLELGRWLAGRRRAAAIDISDGLAIDLHRLCRASGVGAEIEAERLPQATAFDRLAARLDATASKLALAGGEDYVLLFCLPPSLRPPRRFGASRIGVATAKGGIILSENGHRRSLSPTGWDHLR